MERISSIMEKEQHSCETNADEFKLPFDPEFAKWLEMTMNL